MTKQTLNKGSAANDGTGDTLRQGATKIQANFDELYAILGGDSLASGVSFDATNKGIIFEGVSADDHETFIVPTDPTADRTITLPDASGNVVLDTSTNTLTNKTLTNPILSPTINCGTSTTSSVQFTWASLSGATSYTATYTVNAGTLINAGTISSPFTITGLSSSDIVNINITPIGGVGTCFTSSSKMVNSLRTSSFSDFINEYMCP